MKKLNSTAQLAVAALSGIIVLHIVMLLALFSQIEPRPPNFVGPLIGATIALSVFTVLLILLQHNGRLIAVAISMLMALPAVGPHKFLTESDPLVLAPMILTGTSFLIILIFYLVKNVRQRGISNSAERSPDELQPNAV